MAQHLAILGPTASGKTALAIKMAKKDNGAVVNADPFQAYKGIAIGTGQPGIDEQQGIPHFGYGELPLDHVLNPIAFGAMVKNWLTSAQRMGKSPILVTGSGLYLRGAWNQFDDLPQVPERIVAKTRRLCRQLGPPALHRYLCSVDPLRASQIHPNDGSRIQRALALHLATGRPPSEYLTNLKNAIPEDWQILLVMPRKETLCDNIAKRVKNMIQAGWQDEVQQLIHGGHEHNLRRLRPLGYDVWLSGKDSKTAEQMVIGATLKYAKRQLTWFKNQFANICHVDSIGLKEEKLDCIFNP